MHPAKLQDSRPENMKFLISNHGYFPPQKPHNTNSICFPFAACQLPSCSTSPSALLAFLRRGSGTVRQRRVVDDNPPRPSSAAPHQSIHSQKTPRQNRKKEAKEKLLHFCKSFSYMDSGNVLLSRAVSSQVPSALKVLTSVFGMGTGGTPSPSSPETVNLFCVWNLFQTTFLV